MWSDHFALDGVIITPITETGQVTERIFKINNGDRLLERQSLRMAGRYPTDLALMRIRSSSV
jgi:hypothetical protein